MVCQRIGTRSIAPIKARATKLGLLASALLDASYCNLQSDATAAVVRSTASRTVHWKHCKAREPSSTAGSVLGESSDTTPQSQRCSRHTPSSVDAPRSNAEPPPAHRVVKPSVAVLLRWPRAHSDWKCARPAPCIASGSPLVLGPAAADAAAIVSRRAVAAAGRGGRLQRPTGLHGRHPGSARRC